MKSEFEKFFNQHINQNKSVILKSRQVGKSFATSEWFKKQYSMTIDFRRFSRLKSIRKLFNI